MCYTDNDNNAQKYTQIGIEILEELEKKFPDEGNLFGLYYNIANGYATLLHLERNKNLGKRNRSRLLLLTKNIFEKIN